MSVRKDLRKFSKNELISIILELREINYKMPKDNELKIQLTISAMREHLTNKLQQQSF